MKMLSDVETARDILQDVFTSFFELGKKQNEILKPKSYLVRATLNKCIDHAARGHRYAKMNAHQSQSADGDEERKDNRDVVRTALSDMNENDRKLLVLYSEGYSYKEIAVILEMKTGSVGKTLSRALKKMKEKIKKLDYELSEG